jgi:CheY-like chemotaxis protein
MFETALVVPETPLLVRIEPGEFERILVNLVVNARDAMNGGGRLTITLEPEIVASDREFQSTLKAGRVVTLTVRDTGEGIIPTLLPRVFEPFFTTKAAGQGSGLGLATVRDTAQRFGGAVSLASGHETVLLVEDAVREVVRRVLERQGYRVIKAPSGPRALALASTWPHEIDLLLSDVIMPDMNGPQLAAQLSSVRPGIRVLYASGYAADALGPMGLATSAVDIIQKPFTPSELAQRVRRASTSPSRQGGLSRQRYRVSPPALADQRAEA